MITSTVTSEQKNYYEIIDSMGRRTKINYCASNITEAYQAFKADTANYRKYGYGKLKRIYNGGVRG